MAEAEREAAEAKEVAAEPLELDVKGPLFEQNDSATPRQVSRSRREASGNLKYRDHDHDGKSSIYSGLDGI